MLVTLSTKVSVERRDEFHVIAANLNITPAELIRHLIDRYLDGDSAPSGNIYNLIKLTRTDAMRTFVLVRFLAEGIDKEATDVLLQRTDEYLKSRERSGVIGT